MRKGQYNREWLDGGEHGFFGVSLGSDYCVEHEWGIAGIRGAFGMVRTEVESLFIRLRKVDIDKPLFGVGVRKIRKNAAVYYEVDGVHIIGYTPGNPDFLKSLANTEKNNWGDSDFLGLWHDNGFALLSTSEDKMRQLWQAFETNDVAIFTGGMQAFSNGSGLNLCIASRMPKEMLDGMHESDTNAHVLQKASEATGIHDKLRKAGKRFYALSPRWADGKKVVFWLNPEDQASNNYGSFTVEELEQWINGEGPIPKAKEKEETEK